MACHPGLPWADVQGKVVGVADGDTLTVLVGEAPVRVLLAHIDAPEKAQPYGQQAKQGLSDLVYRRHVTVSEQERDGYGRVVGLVRVDGQSVHVELVRRGLAWVYVRYNRDPTLPALQEAARTARVGLWRDAQPMPPWEWRRLRRGAG